MIGDWCDECRQFHGNGNHLPLAEVWCPDEFGETREDAQQVRAVDGEDAAEKWARDHDAEGDYTIVGGCDVTVCVAWVGGDEIGRFRVCGETVPNYTARSIS